MEKRLDLFFLKNTFFNMRKLHLIFLLAVLVSSCSTQSADADGKVGSDIKVILQEEPSEEGAKLVIRSETFKIFSCHNFSIVTEQQLKNDEIIITYSGITEPSVCLTALGPAQSLEFFDLQNGIYQINFLNDGIRNEGELTVDDEKYVLKIADPKNVFVETEVLTKS